MPVEIVERIPRPDVTICVASDGQRHFLARLSKRDDTRVLCGHNSCDGLLTSVEVHVKSGERWRLKPLSPGYWPDAHGVWRLTRYAAEGVKRGQEPRYRTPLQRRPLREGAPDPAPPVQPGKFLHDGELVGCPECGRGNLIDFTELRVTTDAENLAKNAEYLESLRGGKNADTVI